MSNYNRLIINDEVYLIPKKFKYISFYRFLNIHTSIPYYSYDEDGFIFGSGDYNLGIAKISDRTIDNELRYRRVVSEQEYYEAYNDIAASTWHKIKDGMSLDELMSDTGLNDILDVELDPKDLKQAGVIKEEELNEAIIERNKLYR